MYKIKYYSQQDDFCRMVYNVTIMSYSCLQNIKYIYTKECDIELCSWYEKKLYLFNKKFHSKISLTINMKCMLIIVRSIYLIFNIPKVHNISSPQNLCYSITAHRSKVLCYYSMCFLLQTYICSNELLEIIIL